MALISQGLSTFRGPLTPLAFAEDQRSLLIGANLTIAVFASNLSLLAVNLSPYRAVLRNLGAGVVSAAAVSLLISMGPVVSLAFSPSWAATTAVLEAYLVVVLSLLARQRASANPYLAYLLGRGHASELRPTSLAGHSHCERGWPAAVEHTSRAAGVPARRPG